MKHLVIIGAGNFGREIYAWAIQTREYDTQWRVKGFLDNRKNILDGHNYDAPILDSPEDYQPKPGDLFICAVGIPKFKKKYCDLLLNRGAEFTNVIHPSVVIGSNVRLGVGVILCPFVVVSCDAQIGNNIALNLHTSVGHDVQIGDYCQINPNVSLGGRSILKEGVTVGSNAVILPNAVLGEYSIVGAGSVVLRTVRAEQTVFGVPAKPVYFPTMNQ